MYSQCDGIFIGDKNYQKRHDQKGKKHRTADSIDKNSNVSEPFK
jgi:hypothetical protein